MKFSKLNNQFRLLIAAALLAGAFASCNNSNKSENKSTESDTTVKNAQPTVSGSDTTRTVKRVGRVGLAAATKNETKEKASVDKEGYYTHTDSAPEYPGGQSSLENYISNNIQYPDDALDNSIEGTVNVQFTIDENGKVGNVRAENSNLGHGLEEAAVKAVSQMPAWTPGKVKGKNVKAW